MMVMKTVNAMRNTTMTPTAAIIAGIVILFGSGGNWVVPLVKDKIA